MRMVVFMTLPLCKNCVHYIPERSDSLARCKKIGTIDVVQGTVEYSTALSVRENACGQQGILYKPAKHVWLKNIVRHQNTPHVVYLTIYFLYITTLLYVVSKIK
jgi:hypothetical protein